MTVNSEPLISRSLALLEDYRRTAAATSAREEELTKDIARRRYAAERKYHHALKDSTTRLTRESAEADKLWKSRYEATRERHAARHLRLEKAERSARREMPKRVAEKRGDWLGSLQRQKLRLEKEVTGKIGTAAASLAEVQQKLSSQQEQLDALDARSRSALRGSLALRAMVMRAGVSSGGDAAAVDAAVQTAGSLLAGLKKQPLASLTSVLPVWLVAPLLAVAGAVLLWALQMPVAGAACGVLLLAVLGIHFAALPTLRTAAGELAAALGEARATHATLGTNAAARHSAETQEAHGVGEPRQRRQRVEALLHP